MKTPSADRNRIFFLLLVLLQLSVSVNLEAQNCVPQTGYNFFEGPAATTCLLSPSGLDGFQEYDWRYRTIGGQWQSQGVTSIAAIFLINLTSCTDYEWQVRVKCSNGFYSSWLGTGIFQTTNCPQNCFVPTNYFLTESSITQSSATFNVTLTGFQSYEWRYRLTGTSGWTSVFSSTASRVVTGLDECENYQWQVSVQCSNGAWSGFLGNRFFDTDCLQTCVVPQNYTLTESNISETSATLSINLSGFQSYDWRYRLDGSTVWTNVSSTSNSSRVITGLDNCSSYEWQINVQCSNGVWTDWFGSGDFDTDCPQTCVVPQNYTLTESNISETSATLSINLSGFQSYDWRYRLDGSTVWTNVSSTSNSSRVITGLDNCSSYDWQINVQCSNGVWTDWFGSGDFDTDCPQTCVVPQNYTLTESNISETSATLSINLSGFQSYDWRYRLDGSTVWTNVSSTSSSSRVITGLDNCSSYEWQINVQCSNGVWTDWFGSGDFDTDCPQTCVVPQNYTLTESNISETSATLSINLSGFQSYDWRYRLDGSTVWTNVSSTSNSSRVITGLDNCSSYEWQINVQCSNGVWTDWFGSGDFDTDCPQTCVVPQNYTLTESNISETSATLSINLSGFQSYDWRYRLDGSTVWTNVSSTSNSSRVITGLDNCSSYDWQINVQCSNGVWTDWFGSGDFDTDCPQTCVVPQNYTLTESNISETSATLSINLSGFQSYDWRYRLDGSTVWTNVSSTSSSSRVITGLDNCSSYEWQINVQCSNGVWTDWFGSGDFDTDCPQTCVVPQNYTLTESNISETSATLSINLSGFQSYDWRYRLDGSTVWTNVSSTSNSSRVITGLDNCSSYEWQINVQCSNGVWTDWFGSGDFDTDCPQTCVVPQNYTLTESNISETSATLSINLSGFQSYDWRYRLDGSTVWTNVSSTSNSSRVITGLDNCSSYDWQINVQCSNGVWTDWFGSGDFDTDCPQTCVVPQNYTLTESNISETSATLSINLSGFQSYDWRYRLDGSTVWTNVSSTSSSSRVITGLDNCSSYEWQINVQCSNGVWTDWFGSGDFDTDCPQTCVVPANYFLSVSDVSETSVTLNTSVSGYQSYDWRYRLVGVTTWTNVSSTSIPRVGLNGLDSCSSYEWQINIQCSNGVWTGWFGSGLFDTECQLNCMLLPGTTIVINELSIDEIRGTLSDRSYDFYQWRLLDSLMNIELVNSIESYPEVLFEGLDECSAHFVECRVFCNGTWTDWSLNQAVTTGCTVVCNEDTGSINTTFGVLDTTSVEVATIDPGLFISWKWRYKPELSQEWIFVQTNNRVILLSALENCTDYEVELSAKCIDGYWTPWIGQGGFSTCAVSSSRVPRFHEKLLVYPNPASTVVNFNNSKRDVIVIYSADGKVVGSVKGERYDCSSLRAGLYILRNLESGNVGRFMKK